MADQENSRPIARPMMRCVSASCRRWQTIDHDAVNGSRKCGACGGELELVDWEAHLKTVPRVPYDASKDPSRKK